MRGAAVFALAVLAGCSDPSGVADWLIERKLTINVWNQGAEQVRVHMIVRDSWEGRRDENFLLDAGAGATFDYDDVESLEIRAWRTSDGVEIFSEGWHSPELNRHENVYLFP